MPKSKFDTMIIAIGNPGAGKSTFLNALAGETVFKSGINIGSGLTYQLDVKINDKGKFLDTPGLADEELRKEAGKAISDGLRKNGLYKIMFFITEQNGRVNSQDATTLKLVLDAAPDIGQNYGVIVNMVGKKVLKKLENERDRLDFLYALFAGIPEEQSLMTNHAYNNQVIFFPAKDQLDQEDNAFISAHDLVSDKGKTLQEFVDKCIPRVHLQETKVANVDTATFDEMNKKLEERQAEMQRKDDELKKQRTALDMEKEKALQRSNQWRVEKMEIEQARNEKKQRKDEDIQKDVCDEKTQYRKVSVTLPEDMLKKDEEWKRELEQMKQQTMGYSEKLRKEEEERKKKRDADIKEQKLKALERDQKRNQESSSW